ncbi:unnamed protein product, partial [Ectocarpus sp. 4 AP-2014]
QDGECRCFACKGYKISPCSIPVAVTENKCDNVGVLLAVVAVSSALSLCLCFHPELAGLVRLKSSHKNPSVFSCRPKPISQPGVGSHLFAGCHPKTMPLFLYPIPPSRLVM